MNTAVIVGMSTDNADDTNDAAAELREWGVRMRLYLAKADDAVRVANNCSHLPNAGPYRSNLLRLSWHYAHAAETLRKRILESFQ